MSTDVRARLDAMQARADAATYVGGDMQVLAGDALDLLAFARDVLDLADRWVEEDGPHPSHDHHCPDDLRDEVRALAARHLGGGSDD